MLFYVLIIGVIILLNITNDKKGEKIVEGKTFNLRMDIKDCMV